MVFFTLNVVPGLYQSWTVLIFAYLVLFLPQSIGPLRASLVRVRPSIEEAARGLGRTRGSVLATVTLPLIVPGMVSGFALVFLTTMKELPATLLLAPIEFDTPRHPGLGARRRGLLRPRRGPGPAIDRCGGAAHGADPDPRARPA